MNIHTREEVTQIQKKIDEIIKEDAAGDKKLIVMEIASELRAIEAILDSMDRFLSSHNRYDKNQIRVESESFMYYDNEIIAVYNKYTKEFEPIPYA